MIKRAIEKLTSEGYYFDLNKYFEHGTKIFMSKIWYFAGFSALYIIANITIARFPFLFFSFTLLCNVFIAGYYIVANAIIRNEKLSFDKFFEGFKLIIPLLLSNLLITIFIATGLLFLVIPGIYLSIAYLFTVPFITFFNMEVWEAMEASRKIITKNFWPFLGLILIIALINILGAILMGIGLIFTIPLTHCILYAAFEDIIGGATREISEEETNQSYTYTD